MGLQFFRTDPIDMQLDAVRERVKAMNTVDASAGLPARWEQDRDWTADLERKVALFATCEHRAARRFYLLSLCAVAVAALVAEDQAELADPFSGDETEAA